MIYSFRVSKNASKMTLYMSAVVSLLNHKPMMTTQLLQILCSIVFIFRIKHINTLMPIISRLIFLIYTKNVNIRPASADTLKYSLIRVSILFIDMYDVLLGNAGVSHEKLMLITRIYIPFCAEVVFLSCINIFSTTYRLDSFQHNLVAPIEKDQNSRISREIANIIQTCKTIADVKLEYFEKQEVVILYVTDCKSNIISQINEISVNGHKMGEYQLSHSFMYSQNFPWPHNLAIYMLENDVCDKNNGNILFDWKAVGDEIINIVPFVLMNI